MIEYLEAIVDKFSFKVATDRFYNEQGLWAAFDGARVRIGFSDFVQQRSGDVAFVDVKPAGTSLTRDDEVAAVETIKVTIAYNSPVCGTIVRVNPALGSAPEVINQDPYGEGWLVEIDTLDAEKERASLLDAPTYFQQMKGEAEDEAGRL